MSSIQRPMWGPPRSNNDAAELAVRDLQVVYEGAVQALGNVNLDVPAGTIAAVLGANGAGKTTLLRAISGLLAFHDGEIVGGEVRLDGKSIVAQNAATSVKSGLAQVMEGRRIFAELTVMENLQTGAFANRERRPAAACLSHVFGLFPVLRDRRDAKAGLLSGGEQQMLAIGRALMARPRLLVLDEPSLSLAPVLVRQIAEAIVEINRRGASVLLVEQNAHMALSIADRGFVLENGMTVLDGTAAQLRGDSRVQEVYLGLGRTIRRSGREANARNPSAGSTR